MSGLQALNMTIEFMTNLHSPEKLILQTIQLLHRPRFRSYRF